MLVLLRVQVRSMLTFPHTIKSRPGGARGEGKAGLAVIESETSS